MGLIGVVIASLVNLFLASSTLQFVVSIVGIHRMGYPID
jgi:FtsH-binding integral membrane protein